MTKVVGDEFFAWDFSFTSEKCAKASPKKFRPYFLLFCNLYKLCNKKRKAAQLKLHVSRLRSINKRWDYILIAAINSYEHSSGAGKTVDEEGESECMLLLEEPINSRRTWPWERRDVYDRPLQVGPEGRSYVRRSVGYGLEFRTSCPRTRSLGCHAGRLVRRKEEDGR